MTWLVATLGGAYIALILGGVFGRDVAQARRNHRAQVRADAAWEAAKHDRCLTACRKILDDLAKPVLVEGEQILPPVLFAFTEEAWDEHVRLQVHGPDDLDKAVEPVRVNYRKIDRLGRMRPIERPYIGGWGGSL